MPDQINEPVADQPQTDSQTDDQQDQPQQDEAKAPEVQEEPKADQPQPAPQAEEKPEETDINLEKFTQERYKTSPTQAPAEDLTKELSSLPTDEYGTVDAEAAAKWFQDKLEQTRVEARREAANQGHEAAMAILSETAQQQELLNKFPEVKKDREFLETIFDLRDAAALKGQSLSLTEAAQRVDKFRQAAQSEGAQSANRTTQIQAAAHLESSGVTSKSNESEQQRLTQQALHGSGQEATDARRRILKGLVEKDIQEGRIVPS